MVCPSDKEHFERLYQESYDPWNYLSSPYEQEKYEKTLQALLRPHYGFILEVGCSIGVLSAKLASKAQKVLGIDNNEEAIARAKLLYKNNKKICFECCSVPQEWPWENQYDLIVFSEILYYFSPKIIEKLALYARKSLKEDGECVLVNYTGYVEEQVQGLEAANIFCNAFLGLHFCHEKQRIFKTLRFKNTQYCIDVLAPTSQKVCTA